MLLLFATMQETMISEVTPAIKVALLKIVEEYQQQKEVKISQELKVLTLELKHISENSYNKALITPINVLKA